MTLAYTARQTGRIESRLLKKYGKQTDAYFKAFQLQWPFIKTYQIDSEFHGVYEMIGPDGIPTNSTMYSPRHAGPS